MARAAKKDKVSNARAGIFNFIQYDPELMEDEKGKAPKILIDDFVGIFIDEDNFELMKVKQVTVTEDNIKSATNTYGDKYGIGDTYQEWISMTKYLDSYESAVECYTKLMFKNDASALKYCTNISELIKIRQNIHDTIYKFMTTNTIPSVAKEMNNSIKELNSLNGDIQQIKGNIEKYKKYDTHIEELYLGIKEKHKIIVEVDKPKKYKTKPED